MAEVDHLRATLKSIKLQAHYTLLRFNIQNGRPRLTSVAAVRKALENIERMAKEAGNG